MGELLRYGSSGFFAPEDRVRICDNVTLQKDWIVEEVIPAPKIPNTLPNEKELTSDTMRFAFETKIASVADNGSACSWAGRQMSAWIRPSSSRPSLVTILVSTAFLATPLEFLAFCLSMLLTGGSERVNSWAGDSKWLANKRANTELRRASTLMSTSQKSSGQHTMSLSTTRPNTITRSY